MRHLTEPHKFLRGGDELASETGGLGRWSAVRTSSIPQPAIRGRAVRCDEPEVIAGLFGETMNSRALLV